MEIMKKDTITSLELLKQINFFRKKEKEKFPNDRLYSNLKHDSLLKVIRNEFEEEINLGELNEVKYVDSKNRKYPMFKLTPNQAKQVLLKESKIVRKAVIHYIEKLETALKEKNSSEWLTARKNGKLMRKETTDAIQDYLIPHALQQGSRNFKMFYTSYTKLVNKVCEIKAGQRENLKDSFLMYIGFIENFIMKTIIEEVENGTYYKDIYKICKTKCETLKSINPPSKDKYIVKLLEDDQQ